MGCECHSCESRNPENLKAGFPRIKYGAGSVKHGMTEKLSAKETAQILYSAYLNLNKES